MRGYNNIGGYNTQQYNASGSELNFVESTTLTDTTIPVDYATILYDFLFLDATLTIQVTSKSLTEVIRLADWLSIERTPVNNEWYD